MNDEKTAALFAWVRHICGVRLGPECLPPDVEGEAAFRKLADY
jgi:hypothetical protein